MIKRELCPISGRQSSVIFARPYSLPELKQILYRPSFEPLLADKLYEVRHCPESGIYFQTWVMEEHELADWYTDADGTTIAEDIARQRLRSFAHQTEEILVFRQLCPSKMPVVLDFGCNWGKWASMALAYGCEVYGVDVNRQAAEFCSQRGIRMLQPDQLAGMEFDFINCDQVIEHLRDPVEMVSLFSRCLKPGGFLKLSTPDGPRLPKVLAAAQRSGSNDVIRRGLLEPLWPLGHINLFTRRSLDYTARKAGLEPFRLPLFKWMGAGQLWNIPRQFERNIRTPFKRWGGAGTYSWYRKGL